jgi:hypothetical protein
MFITKTIIIINNKELFNYLPIVLIRFNTLNIINYISSNLNFKII